MNRPEIFEHVHEFLYYAAINLDIGNETVGVIDVWRCSSCHVKSAELRAHGLNNLAAEAGFQVFDGPDVKWVLLVCSAQEIPKFDLLTCRTGDFLDHDCVERSSPIVVASNYSLEDKSDEFHRLINLEDYFNENVNISSDANGLLPTSSLPVR